MKSILARIGSTFLVLVASTFLIFGALQLAPGSPLAALSGDRPLTPEQVLVLEKTYHLNEPFLTRYLSWIWDLVHGNLGVSIVQNDSVANLIGQRIETTALLVVYAAVLVLTFGLLAGVISALSGPRVKTAITFATTILLASPSFVYALVFVSIFAVDLAWFPVFGSGTGVADRLWHLTLPALSLGLSGSAVTSRIVRNSMTEELGKEYIEVARARGMKEGRVVVRHALRNSLVPTVTVAGLMIAALFADTAVVETAFDMHGMGQLLVDSVLSKDFAVVQAITLLIVVIFLLTNLVVDISYRFLDPRMSKAMLT